MRRFKSQMKINLLLFFRVCHQHAAKRSSDIVFQPRALIPDNEAAPWTLGGNRSAAGTPGQPPIRLSRTPTLTHSACTHVRDHTCNTNSAAEQSRPVITAERRERHNHKDSNRNVNPQMIPDCFIPSVYRKAHCPSTGLQVVTRSFAFTPHQSSGSFCSGAPAKNLKT